MSAETWLQKKLKTVAGRVGYETERVVLGINEQIHDHMQRLGVTRVGLAEELGVSKSYVSRTLNGAPNMTIRTLVSIANALGCRIAVTFTRTNAHVAERPKVCELDEFVRQRQRRNLAEGSALLASFKPFVPPAPAPEKQNAAA